MSTDRRHFRRYPKTSEFDLKLSKNSHKSKTVDYSLGGLGAVRSSAHMGRLAELLKIRESFLTFSGAGVYDEYPFLADFYVFCLTDKKIADSYEFILKYICARSEFIDALFLHVRSSLMGAPYSGGRPVIYIVMKDDRGTMFFLRRHLRAKGFGRAGARLGEDRREIEVRTFPRVDYFREQLHLSTKYVHDMTGTVPAELYEKIEGRDENAEKRSLVTRDDLLSFFPGGEYFLGQYEAHAKAKTDYSTS